ncbi:hypothetical protein [Lebetimonas sp. JS032]|uniref:hypothetical protein n=1 Tax=Lebetimonas sp. JS032 TaxID=990070 RepID=UPI0004B5DB78|nr:hypothetical protein [Lebetimonas sp. JS032]
MLKIFKKDIEKVKKSGKYSKEDFETLKQIVEKLQASYIIVVIFILYYFLYKL